MNSFINDLRNAMLQLHKALLDAERLTYQESFGPIRSPHHFLQLLTGDPHFAWLRPLSTHVVIIDEAMDAKVPPTPEAIEGLIQEAVLVLATIQESKAFSFRYQAAMQSTPDVVLAHARIVDLLSRRPPAALQSTD